MAHFLNKDPADIAIPWMEWHIQAYIVQELRKDGYLIIGDMAAGKRNPGKAKAAGLIAGHPDLSIWLSGGRVILIELKRTKERLSQEQIDHHARLVDMGHTVHTVWASCPADGLEQVRILLSIFMTTNNGEQI